VPVWRTLSESFKESMAEKKKAAESKDSAAEQAGSEPRPESQTERVLRLFRGTLVNEPPQSRQSE
jgi:hypothetical protein